MRRDIANFMVHCLICQQIKIEHQRPLRLLSLWELPEWKWEEIMMNFVMGLPNTRRKHNAIWVIVDRLSKSSHFLAIYANMPLETLAELYIREKVRLHGIPKAIVSNRDPRFISRFWNAFQNDFDTKFKMTSTFHFQTDGQSEITILTIDDMLKACVMEWQGDWYKHLPLVEFVYNNSYHASIGMVPFETLYGRRCHAPGIFRFGKKGKLSAKYIGPFEVIERIRPLAYRLALPPHLSQVHDVFHISILRKYLPDPIRQTEYAEVQVDKRLNVPEVPIRIVDEHIRRLRNK
ncbi:unnamed protein product [Victoria cruziana]